MIYLYPIYAALQLRRVAAKFVPGSQERGYDVGSRGRF